MRVYTQNPLHFLSVSILFANFHHRCAAWIFLGIYEKFKIYSLNWLFIVVSLLNWFFVCALTRKLFDIMCWMQYCSQKLFLEGKSILSLTLKKSPYKISRQERGIDPPLLLTAVLVGFIWRKLFEMCLETYSMICYQCFVLHMIQEDLFSILSIRNFSNWKTHHIFRTYIHGTTFMFIQTKGCVLKNDWLLFALLIEKSGRQQK